LTQVANSALNNVQTLGNSLASTFQSQLKNLSDKSVFMRHGDIKVNFSVDLKFIRDMNNVLGLLTEADHEELLFAINEDTLGKICKFHNIQKDDLPSGARYSTIVSP
jgi:hypothetical protein